MANVQQVSFTSPYSDDEAEILRQQRMAEMLRGQAMQPMGGTEMAGGIAIRRSPFEGLAKIANAANANSADTRAREMARALRERQQGDVSADMGTLSTMLRGAPASSEQVVDEQANDGMGAAATINAPARAGGFDPGMMAQLRSPFGQNFAMQQFAQQMQRENAPPERVDLGDKIGLVKNGQIVGYLPKGASPDVVLKEGGSDRRHATPSGGTILTHTTPSAGATMADDRARAEGAAGRAVTVRGQNLTDERAKEAAGAGRIPPGYRYRPGGSLEAIPGGPADEKEAKKVGDTKKVVDMYVAARDGVMTGLEGSITGPIVGRAIPFTAKQQIAEGGVAAMAPVLKQLFRVAGEGVFTDRDQALLLDMVPKRTDEPEARKEKMANIDRIVSAKMGMPVPSRLGGGAYAGPERRAGGDDPLGLRKK